MLAIYPPQVATKYDLSKYDAKIMFSLTTYSMKQPDIYYFEAIEMTSQTESNFVWRIRAADVISLFKIHRAYLPAARILHSKFD